MTKLKPYLPLALRIAATIAAGLAVLVAAQWSLSPEHLGESATAAGLAWARWHPSASLKALFAYLGVPDDGEATPAQATASAPAAAPATLTAEVDPSVSSTIPDGYIQNG